MIATATKTKSVNIYKHLCKLAEGILTSSKNDLHEHDHESLTNFTAGQEAIWCVYSAGTRLNIIPNTYQWDETKSGELIFIPNNPAETVLAFNAFHWGHSSIKYTESEYGKQSVKPQYYRILFIKKGLGICDRINYNQAIALSTPIHKISEFWFRLGYQSFYYGGITVSSILENLNTVNCKAKLLRDLETSKVFKHCQGNYLLGRSYANQVSRSSLPQQSSHQAWNKFSISNAYKNYWESAMR